MVICLIIKETEQMTFVWTRSVLEGPKTFIWQETPGRIVSKRTSSALIWRAMLSHQSAFAKAAAVAAALGRLPQTG
jgi:hypothetical protein